MTGRIEKTVFISYRRTNFPWAYCIYQDLTHHGFDVFFDYQSIDSGNFEKVILENIRARAHFIVILSPSALERCNQPGDWLRREIETAMDERRNIIPVMLEGFDFGSPIVKNALTGKLASLNSYSGMSLIAEYVEAGFDKLRNRFLNIALEDIHLHALPDNAKEITETQIAAANNAPPVEKEELTAQKWFERAFVFNKEENYDEVIRCATNAVDLQSDFANAYYVRGYAKFMKDDYEGALSDFDKTIFIDPKNPGAHASRAVIREKNNDLDGAIEDYTETTQFEELGVKVIAETYHRRGNINLKQGKTAQALKDFSTAIELAPNLIVYYFSRGKAHLINNDFSAAIADFDVYLQTESDDFDAYYGRGLAHAMKADSYEALTNLDKAIHLKPDHVAAYKIRALMHENVKNLEESVADYQKYLKLGGGEQEGEKKEVQEKIKILKRQLARKKYMRKKKAK